MKPDGVEAATMEPMQALDTDPVNEAAPLVEGTGEAPPPSQTEEIGQGEQQPAETPAADTKTNKDKPVDPKAKTKGSAKTKTPTSGNRTTTGARPATAQSRVVNGVQKPQANGVAKKTATGTPDKKSMSSSATSKRPVGNASAPGSKTTTTKVNEKKPAGTTRPATAPAATNGTKTAGTTQAKKSTVLPANGVKTKPKTTAPRPATAVTTKPSTTASPKSDRPPVSKTTRPAGGPTSTRPSSAAPKPATSTTAKTSTSPTKPITATAKAASSTSKPSPSKTSTTTPSAGRTPSQASKTTTPIKKDVSKPTTPAAKKPASSPLTRPSTAKTTKPDTPKSATTTKTESASKKPTPKVTDTKTGRPKTQEGKTTASKDVNASPKTPSSKPSTAKATSPKKAVGSSTPMPVKRGPKSPADATPKESEKKEAEKQDVAPALATAAATAAAAAAATAAAVTIAAPEPEPSVEAAVAPVAEHLEPVSTQDIQTTAEVEKPDTTVPQLAAQLDLVQLEGPADDVSPLGTTVMSPPSSPTGPEVQPMEIQSSAPLAGMHIEADLWAQDQSLSPSAVTQESLLQEEVRPQEDVLMPTEVAPEVQKEAEQPFSLTAEPDLIRTSPVDHFAHAAPSSPFQEQEEAVEKAEEEINEDDEDEDEEQEEKQIEKPRMVLETSSAPKMEEFQVESSDFSSSAWDMLHADDTQRSKNIDDFSQMPSEREEPFHGSQAVKAFSNDDEDEAEEVHDEEHDFDFGSKNADDQGKLHQEEEEEDEDVEMVSEEKTEVRFQSYGNLDEDDFAYDSRLDNMARTAPEPSIPMATAWASSNPFADTWAQPPSSQGASSPFSDLGAADPKSPVEACMDFSAPDLVPQSEQPTQCAESLAYMASHDVVESSFPMESATLAPPPVAMSQSSTLSGTALAAHSSSETSTPEELREYDSSSGVESRSDKQQTPVPTTQPDMEQDLGIHLERGDGEEEEAETLPADEVLGGPPTAPASAPSSPSTSGDEASDTEGEMQINDPDAPVEDTAAFDSSPASHNLPALEEDEEAADMQIGEEDGGTPQSANSVASYGFDCSVSNSNAHSTAESCGKSPGIFSLENEDQLTDEAKDPSLIKELTLPAATANVEDLLGCPVDLLPLGQPGETHEYLLCGKAGANVLEEDDPLESDTHLSPQHPGDSSDGQPPYYSAVCDKTDSFLAGENTSNAKADKRQRSSPPLNQPEVNHNQIHYLAPMQNNSWHQQSVTHLNDLVRIQANPPPRAPQAALAPTAQLRRLEQHQLHLRQIQQRQEQERQKRIWLEEERQRQEQQRQLERQRRELLQLQLQQQQQEHRQRRQLLQWQLELEQQHRLKQQQQQHKGQSAVLLSPSSGLCTIYEAMETSEDEEERSDEAERATLEKNGSPRQASYPVPTDLPLRVANGNLRRPPQDLDWNKKVDMVQQLINQTMLLSGDGEFPPLLLLPGPGGGTLSPLETSLWPDLPQLSSPSATVTSVSSYSPDSQGSSPQGDWTVVEVETHH